MNKFRVMVIGPFPPPHGGWSHVVSSVTRLAFPEPLSLIPYDTKLRDDIVGGTSSSCRLFRRAVGQVLGLGRAIAACQPGMVLLFTGPGGSFWRDLLLLRACYDSGLPTAIRFFGGAILERIRSLPTALRLLVLRHLARTRAFLVETTEMVDRLRVLFPGTPSYRVPNFIHVEDLPVSDPVAHLPGVLGVAFIGNMTRTKGIETILESVDSVCSQHRVAFHFIGGEIEPGYLDRFRSRISVLQHADSVHIHGRLPRNQAHALASRCQVFAFPTQWPGEGQPAALLEAMGMGLVPIATRWKGVAEIVHDGVNGLLVEPADPASLSDMILRLVEDQGLRRTLSRNARETVFTGYSAFAAMDQYRQILVDMQI